MYKPFMAARQVEYDYVVRLRLELCLTHHNNVYTKTDPFAHALARYTIYMHVVHIHNNCNNNVIRIRAS